MFYIERFPNLVPPVIIFLLAFFLSTHLTGLMRWISHFLRVLDHPDDRKHQSEPVPCLGGVAIVIAISVSLLVTYGRVHEIQLILAVGAGIAVVGVLDDIFGVSAVIKLAALAVACLILQFNGVALGRTPFALANYLLTFLWVAGVASAFNAMDNADGLAGCISLICSLALFLLGWSTWQLYFSFLAMSLAGAVLGFLHHNMKPARIYMGDSGSFYLGYILAVLIILGEWSDNSWRASIGGGLVLLVPIYDLGLVTLLRVRHGIVDSVHGAIAHSDRDHISHRLLHLGMSHGNMVAVICTATALCCAAAMIVVRAPLVMAGIVLLVLFSLLLGAGIFLDAKTSNPRLWVSGRDLAQDSKAD